MSRSMQFLTIGTGPRVGIGRSGVRPCIREHGNVQTIGKLQPLQNVRPSRSERFEIYRPLHPFGVKRILLGYCKKTLLNLPFFRECSSNILGNLINVDTLVKLDQ